MKKKLVSNHAMVAGWISNSHWRHCMGLYVSRATTNYRIIWFMSIPPKTTQEIAKLVICQILAKCDGLASSSQRHTM